MKFSFYNVAFKYNSDYILYNVYSDAILAISSEVYQLITECENDPHVLRHIHPELFETMCKLKFIIERDMSEYEEIVKELKEVSMSYNSYHLTINPTMDCNFRCWYCYEKHNVNSCMDLKTVESVKGLITNIVSDVKISKLILSFFGGEPMMYYKKIVHPIIQYAKGECDKYGKPLDIYITTNGYLLKDNVIKDLRSYPFVSLQIPIDGGKVFHDAVKKLSNNSGTFDVVLNNSIKAIELGLDVTIRCNYTNHNIDSFTDLLRDFEKCIGKNNLCFAFHKVWQEPLTENLKNKVFEVNKLFIEKGLSVTNNVVQKGMCYADYNNSAVINYNGDVFKCTARDFCSANRLGLLFQDGTIDWNENSLKRNKCKYESKACEMCKFFPICRQGCSQNAYEHQKYNECLMGYTDKDVLDMIESRIKYKLLYC